MKFEKGWWWCAVVGKSVERLTKLRPLLLVPRPFSAQSALFFLLKLLHYFREIASGMKYDGVASASQHPPSVSKKYCRYT